MLWIFGDQTTMLFLFPKTQWHVRKNPKSNLISKEIYHFSARETKDLFVVLANFTEKIEAISTCIYKQLFSHRLLLKYEGSKADLYVKTNTTFQLPGSLEQQCREMMEGSNVLYLLYIWKKNMDSLW